MQTKKYEIRILLTMILLLSFFSLANGQKKNSDFVLYIENHCDLAIDHMKRYKIPASITLAQGLLESNAGKSFLAKEGNNHFGIKCQNWGGPGIYKTDDAPNECFRKYKNVKESYEDHSLFLGRSRYAPLFLLKTNDYKGWAKGLLECGYATDTRYATKLIDIIELYELHRYDSKYFYPRDIYKMSNLVYVIADDGDSFRSIASDLHLKEKNLIKYNEYPNNYRLRAGDIVYLQKKKTKADKSSKREHVIRAGESLHSISQRYGIRVDNLYKMNKKNGQDFTLTEGDILRLR